RAPPYPPTPTPLPCPVPAPSPAPDCPRALSTLSAGLHLTPSDLPHGLNLEPGRLERSCAPDISRVLACSPITRRNSAALAPTLPVTLASASGCSRAHSARPAIQPTVAAPSVTAPASPLPPIATSTLPPAPVPATFDVAALADQVRPMVVNITTTQK